MTLGRGPGRHRALAALRAGHRRRGACPGRAELPAAHDLLDRAGGCRAELQRRVPVPAGAPLRRRLPRRQDARAQRHRARQRAAQVRHAARHRLRHRVRGVRGPRLRHRRLRLPAQARLPGAAAHRPRPGARPLAATSRIRRPATTRPPRSRSRSPGGPGSSHRDQVRWVEAEGDYVRLHTADGSAHLVRMPISHLEERWSALRVHPHPPRLPGAVQAHHRVLGDQRRARRDGGAASPCRSAAATSGTSATGSCGPGGGADRARCPTHQVPHRSQPSRQLVVWRPDQAPGAARHPRARRPAGRHQHRPAARQVARARAARPVPACASCSPWR